MLLGANTKTADLAVFFLDDALQIARLDSRALLADSNLSCHGFPFGAPSRQGAEQFNALNVPKIVTY